MVIAISSPYNTGVLLRGTAEQRSPTPYRFLSAAFTADNIIGALRFCLPRPRHFRHFQADCFGLPQGRAPALTCAMLRPAAPAFATRRASERHRRCDMTKFLSSPNAGLMVSLMRFPWHGIITCFFHGHARYFIAAGARRHSRAPHFSRSRHITTRHTPDAAHTALRSPSPARARLRRLGTRAHWRDADTHRSNKNGRRPVHKRDDERRAHVDIGRARRRWTPRRTACLICTLR